MLSHVLLCASYSLPASYDHEIFPGRIRSGLPFPSPGERPNSWIKPKSPVLQADSEPLLLLLLLLSRFSHAQLLATTWTGAYQAPLSMGSSRQEYCSGLPFPSLGDLLNPGTEPRPPALAGRFFPSEPPGKSKGLLTEATIIPEDSNSGVRTFFL